MPDTPSRQARSALIPTPRLPADGTTPAQRIQSDQVTSAPRDPADQPTPAPRDPADQPTPAPRGTTDRATPGPHILTDAQFAALGAGRPTAATLAVLRRAQLSRHLLLLREIARAAPGPGFAELAAAERADPGVRQRLSDPLVGAWAASCLAALRRGASPGPAGAGRLTTLATAARSGHRLRAEHDGLLIDVRLEDADPVRARLGLTPTGRLTAAEVARWQDLFAAAWRLLVARHRADAELLAAVLRVIVPVAPDPAARGISATSADAYGAVALSFPADAAAFAVGLLHETRHSLLNAVGHLFDLHTEPDALGYSPWRDDPRPASGILHGAYAYLAVTRFWRTEARHSSPAPTPTPTRDQHGHEPAAPAQEQQGHRPTAPDPAAADRHRNGLAPEPAGDRNGGRLAAFEFGRWRGAVAVAASGQLAGGGLTAAGRRFVGALLDEVRPWLAEPVPAEVARLAEGANADHELRWRLRNLAVEPADAHALADRWRHGQAPPDRPARSRLLPAPRRALENSTRLNLTHARLRAAPDLDPAAARAELGLDPAGTQATTPGHGPAEAQAVARGSRPARGRAGRGVRRATPELGQPAGGFDPADAQAGVSPAGQSAGGRGSAGDVAYLGGDHGTAADAYERIIDLDPGDDAAWAGLALVRGWREVEVVAAVRRALGEGTDLAALARWIPVTPLRFGGGQPM